MRLIQAKAFEGIENTLEELSLARNSIENIPIQGFAILKKLRVLNLKYNRIHKISEASFYEMHSLEYLYLEGNRIRSLSPDAFRGVADTLENLYLDKNPLEKATFPFFAKLRQISMQYCYDLELSKPLFNTSQGAVLIRFSHNGITHIGHDALSHINVNSLYFKNNRLTEDVVCSSIWASLKGVVSLYLSSNSISSVSAECFKYLNGSILSMLAMHGNNISSIADHAFWGLNSLEKVIVSGNNIFHIGERAFEGLESIKYIALQQNKLSVIGYRMLVHLDRLEYLDVSFNSLRTFIPTRFFSPHFLRYGRLNLFKNKLICGCELLDLRHFNVMQASKLLCFVNGTNETQQISALSESACYNELTTTTDYYTYTNVENISWVNPREETPAYQFMYTLIPVVTCGLLTAVAALVILVKRRDTTSTTQ